MRTFGLFAGIGGLEYPKKWYNKASEQCVNTPGHGADVATRDELTTAQTFLLFPTSAHRENPVGISVSSERLSHTCLVCGSEFRSYNPTPQFCSLKCKNRSQEALIDLELARNLYESGMTQLEIAEKLGTTQKAIHNIFRRNGIKCRKAAKRVQTGDKNSSWKGGRVLSSTRIKRTRFSASGYWKVLTPGHPNADKHGYVAEHRLIMSNLIGRPLTRQENVHHIDADKHNNHPSNLRLCTVKEHREYHLQLEYLAVLLVRQGKIKFSDEVGYYLAEEGQS